MDVEFCLEAPDDALSQGTPEMFNTDQGSQFTSRFLTKWMVSKNVDQYGWSQPSSGHRLHRTTLVKREA